MKVDGSENTWIKANHSRSIRTHWWVKTVNCWNQKYLWIKDLNASAKFVIGESDMGVKQWRHWTWNAEMTGWVRSKALIFIQLSLKRNYWVDWQKDFRLSWIKAFWILKVQKRVWSKTQLHFKVIYQSWQTWQNFKTRVRKSLSWLWVINWVIKRKLWGRNLGKIFRSSSILRSREVHSRLEILNWEIWDWDWGIERREWWS